MYGNARQRIDQWVYQGALARPKPFPRCQSEYSDSTVRAIVVMLVVIVVVVVLFILFRLMRCSRLQIYLVVHFAIYDLLQLNKMKFEYFSF